MSRPVERKAAGWLLFVGGLCAGWLVAGAADAGVPQFRGAGGAGTSDEKRLPVHWSESRNIAWTTDLPGPGTSSPIVVGDRVYLTAYSGYGLVPNEGQQQNLRRHVLAIDRASGKIVWQRTFEPVLPESEYRGGNSSRHGYASSTPASDGEHLFVFFGKTGVFCLDLDGQTVWQADVGEGATGWGSSNSPILAGDLVIVNASVESRAVVALDKHSGKEVWRVEKIRSSWNTPVLVELDGGKSELVLCDSERVLGLDPKTGEELWRVGGFDGYVCPSVVAHDGVVYVVRGNALAIRAGGRGDVSESHVLWNAKGRSVVPSPVYYEGYLYWIPKGGVAHCLDAKTGELVYRERLAPSAGVIYSSLLAADGKLYCVTQHDGTYVLKAGPKFQQLAHNTFADDDSRTNASPVADRGQLLLRTDRRLYCIGK